MGHAVEGRARRQGIRWYAGESMADLFLDEGEKLFHPHAIDDVFQPRLEPVGAVAEVDEHAHNGVGDLCRVRRLDDDARLFCKILVTGDAADAEPKPDTRFD